MERDIEVGTLEDTSAAVARLLSVTHASYERRAQLEHALESRIGIEQAKGIVAERYGLDVDEAFQLIRRAARSHRADSRRTLKIQACPAFRGGNKLANR